MGGEVGSEGRGARRTTSDEAMSQINHWKGGGRKGCVCVGVAGNRGGPVGRGQTGSMFQRPVAERVRGSEGPRFKRAFLAADMSAR
jgi:hypothetical protein